MLAEYKNFSPNVYTITYCMLIAIGILILKEGVKTALIYIFTTDNTLETI